VAPPLLQTALVFRPFFFFVFFSLSVTFLTVQSVPCDLSWTAPLRFSFAAHKTPLPPYSCRPLLASRVVWGFRCFLMRTLERRSPMEPPHSSFFPQCHFFPCASCPGAFLLLFFCSFFSFCCGRPPPFLLFFLPSNFLLLLDSLTPFCQFQVHSPPLPVQWWRVILVSFFRSFFLCQAPPELFFFFLFFFPSPPSPPPPCLSCAPLTDRPCFPTGLRNSPVPPLAPPDKCDTRTPFLQPPAPLSYHMG